MSVALSSLAGRLGVRGELPSGREAVGTYLRIAWPAAVEYLLVALVSLVDSVMVGKLGPWAIAAVGLANQPRMALLAFCHATGAGTTAICSRRWGEGDPESANRCLKQALMITAVITLVTTALVYIFAHPIIVFMGGKSDTIAGGVAYLRIVLVGNALSTLGMVINAGQRGVGNTSLAMKTNVIANLINVALNYCLIQGRLGFPALGISGAALATSIGFAVGFGISVVVTCRKDGFLSLRYPCPWRFDRKTVASLTRLGSGALVEQLCMRGGIMLYTKVAAELGTAAYVAHQICMRILDPAYMMGEGLGTGAAALVGRELGRKRPDLSMIYARIGQLLALTTSTVVAVGFVLCRGPLTRLFTDDTAIVAQASTLMLLVALCCLFMCPMSALGGSLRGAGDVAWVARGALIGQLVLRPSIGFLLCYPMGLGVVGAWLGLLADYIARLILYAIRFARAKWTEIQV